MTEIDNNIEQDNEEIDGLHAVYNESGIEAPIEALHKRVDRLYDHIGEGESEVSIVLTTDEEIKKLNNDWRNLNESTDVLSFPMREDEDPAIAKSLPLGDVVISIETALRYVESCRHKDRLDEQGPLPLTDSWSLLDELTFLVIHSTLHLLGHDHAEPEEEKIMRAKEREWMMYILDSEK